MFDAAAVPSAVVLRERHTGGTRTVLEIVHDGSAPPEALLAELRAAGWQGAVTVPPPASAVDWTTPDPVTGNRYSIRPHRAVVHATLEGPAAARADAVARALAAAARHHPIDPARATDLADAPTTHHDLVCAAANAPAVRAAAATLGTVVDERSEHEVVTVRFRNNSTERVHELRRLRLAVRGLTVEQIRRGLEGTGVRAIEPAGAGPSAVPAIVPPAAARPAVAPAPVPVPASELDPGRSTYELVCTAENAPAVRAALRGIATVLDDRGEWETVTVRFRNNSTERDRELRRMLVAVDHGGIDEVRAALVGTGVRSLEPAG